MAKFMASLSCLLLLLVIGLPARSMVESGSRPSPGEVASPKGQYDETAVRNGNEAEEENWDDDDVDDDMDDQSSDNMDEVASIANSTGLRTVHTDSSPSSCFKKCRRHQLILRRCRKKCPGFKKSQDKGGKPAARDQVEPDTGCIIQTERWACPVRPSMRDRIRVFKSIQMDGEVSTTCTSTPDLITCTMTGEAAANDIIFISSPDIFARTPRLYFSQRTFDCSAGASGPRTETWVKDMIAEAGSDRMTAIGWGFAETGKCVELIGVCKDYQTKEDCTTFIEVKIGNKFHDSQATCPPVPTPGSGCPGSGTCAIEAGKDETVTPCPLNYASPSEGQQTCCDGHYCMPNACCLNEAPTDCCKKVATPAVVPVAPELTMKMCKKDEGTGGVTGSSNGPKGYKGYKGWYKGGYKKKGKGKWHSTSSRSRSLGESPQNEDAAQIMDTMPNDGQQKGDNGKLWMDDEDDEEDRDQFEGEKVAMTTTTTPSHVVVDNDLLRTKKKKPFSCRQTCRRHARAVRRCRSKCPGFGKARESGQGIPTRNIDRYSTYSDPDLCTLESDGLMCTKTDNNYNQPIIMVEGKPPNQVSILIYQLFSYDCATRDGPRTELTPQKPLVCPLGSGCTLTLPWLFEETKCVELKSFGCKVGPTEAEAVTPADCKDTFFYMTGDRFYDIIPCPTVGTGCPALGTCSVEPVSDETIVPCAIIGYPAAEGARDCCEGTYCMPLQCCKNKEPTNCCLNEGETPGEPPSDEGTFMRDGEYCESE